MSMLLNNFKKSLGFSNLCVTSYSTVKNSLQDQKLAFIELKPEQQNKSNLSVFFPDIPQYKIEFRGIK